MASCVLLRVGYLIRPDSDHAEVCHTSKGLSKTIHHRPRVYAVTGNNRRIRACLSLLTLVQFAFGMYLVVRFSLQPGAFPFLHPQKAA